MQSRTFAFSLTMSFTLTPAPDRLRHTLFGTVRTALSALRLSCNLRRLYHHRQHHVLRHRSAGPLLPSPSLTSSTPARRLTSSLTVHLQFLLSHLSPPLQHRRLHLPPRCPPQPLLRPRRRRHLPLAAYPFLSQVPSRRSEPGDQEGRRGLDVLCRSGQDRKSVV